MTQYQLTVDTETLQRLFVGDGQLGRLLENVLNQVLNAQVSEQLQAAPYERSEQRQGYRNGYKPRQLTTRVGALTLLVPPVRDGSFSTELLARYQRSEQALVLTLMEMVVNGVSTRKVARITEELPRSCVARVLPSPPSPICAKRSIQWSPPGMSATSQRSGFLSCSWMRWSSKFVKAVRSAP